MTGWSMVYPGVYVTGRVMYGYRAPPGGVQAPPPVVHPLDPATSSHGPPPGSMQFYTISVSFGMSGDRCHSVNNG